MRELRDEFHDPLQLELLPYVLGLLEQPLSLKASAGSTAVTRHLNNAGRYIPIERGGKPSGPPNLVHVTDSTTSSATFNPFVLKRSRLITPSSLIIT